MRKLTHEEIAQARTPKELLATVERLPIYGMLDNVRSLYNVGSIFRTSDGALIQGLYLCGFTARPPRKEIEKTALGSTESVPWTYFKDPREAMKKAKSDGAKICILEHTTESRPYFEIRKNDFPLCLVVGNEITGVSSEVIAEADISIEIPMFGMKQSLNAAVAYGIALFELVRIWKTR
ncbi:MAG: RNA methyltransferase [Ignavibacteriae bacterium]|nr:RNA methyltransferase [Ignavibacteriota bacterium]